MGINRCQKMEREEISMGSNYRLDYNVDIVMCMDATGSMGSLLDTVKNNALKFYDDLMTRMAAKGKPVNELRVRVIAYRDYLADGDHAMLATDFFSLPEDAKDFEELVRGIKPMGGGDDPEDGLEMSSPVPSYFVNRILNEVPEVYFLASKEEMTALFCLNSLNR